jgi:hypothetical protein
MSLCGRCGRRLAAGLPERRVGAAFLLNELEGLRDEGEIDEDQYLLLRERYLQLLTPEAARPAPSAAPPAERDAEAVPPSVSSRPPKREGPGWLAEQQANLLLYLGAFLIVIAALVYVGSASSTGNTIKMALLIAFTLLFFVAGLICMRVPRVRQAGVVFIAVGSLMMPINFVGAYGFFFANEGIDATGLWLAGSISSALFYAAITYAGLGDWYAIPMVGAALSSLAAALVLSGAPPEAYPGSYIALSLILAIPQLLPLGRASKAFGPTGAFVAHVIVPSALLVALGMTTATPRDFVLRTRWYLPPTAAVGALFYWAQTLAAHRLHSRFEGRLTIAALAVSGGAAVTAVYAIGAGYQWYGPAVATLGWAYASASLLTGKRWAGARHLRWMAMAAVTVSWLLFEGVYKDFPRHGAGVHFAVAAFYLAAARFTDVRLSIPLAAGTAETPQERIDVPMPVALVYGAALTFGMGMYEIVSAAQHVGTAQAHDTVWTFFGASIFIAMLAATTRSWWPQIRPHAYAIVFGMSLFVLVASQAVAGQVALLLVIYTALALALAVWEREPFGLVMPAGYGFVALIAAWRYFGPDDAALPITVSAIGAAIFGFSTLLEPTARRFGLREPSRLWATTLQGIAFGYAVAAPITGGARLAMLSNTKGYVGPQHFENTRLFQTTAGSVALIAIAGATTRWWWRDLKPLIYGIALLMSVGTAAASLNAQGQVLVLLAGYGVIALGLVVCESTPFGLAVPAVYGYCALLAAWRYYEPDMALLPLAVSAVGAGLFAASFLPQIFTRRWAVTLRAIAAAYAMAAPVTGWVRLATLADKSGFIGTRHFEATALYQTSAATVALLASLMIAWWMSLRRLELLAGASALLMVAGLLEVGHFRPDNVQAYTAPLGAYTLVVALLSLRIRTLPADAQWVIGCAEALGAALIMGPSFVQSLDAHAWRYGLILLAESIGAVLLALVQRRIWLMGAATTFVVMDGAHYLFFAGGPVLPNWAILAIAGTAVMAAGTAILLGRDRWTDWQRSVQTWWYRETPEPPAALNNA